MLENFRAIVLSFLSFVVEAKTSRFLWSLKEFEDAAGAILRWISFEL